MNTEKASNYGRIIAFILIASVLLGTFSFAAEGWQAITDNDTNDNATEESGDVENNTMPDEEIVPNEPYVPKYVNMLTGLETDERTSLVKPVAFVINSGAPIYGINGSDLICEFPTEDGTTRMLVFTHQYESIGKIGSLAPSRGYISNYAKYFSGILAANGTDDSFAYQQQDVSQSFFDLSKSIGYHYTEFTHFAYTNGALLSAGLTNAGIVTSSNPRGTSPFNFPEYGDDKISFETSAKSISLPFGADSRTDLYYSDDESGYTISKNGVYKMDMLSDSVTVFENVFVLFSDSVTYENSEGTEMIMDTMSAGKGLYATGGTIVELCWSITPQGTLELLDSEGVALTVNRGSSYIGIVKSSLIGNVEIS